jgi:chromosome partitioning protein
MAFRAAVLAEKGGVGKTTTSLHLAIALTNMGHRVLLVDLDPQKNLTEWLIADQADAAPALATIYQVLEDPHAPTERMVTSTRFPGLDIIQGARGLGLPEALLGKTKSGRPRDPNNVLETALRQVDDRYDVIIMDGPPSVGLVNGNALVAAQVVIVPIEPGEFAFRGLTKIGDTIKEMLDEHIIQEPPAIAALLTLVKVGRRTNAQYETQAQDALKDYDRGHVFKSAVRYREVMQRIPGDRLTAFDLKKKDTNDVVHDYVAVADELIAFLERMAQNEALSA